MPALLSALTVLASVAPLGTARAQRTRDLLPAAVALHSLQDSTGAAMANGLDSLVAHALAVSPVVKAASARAEAVRHRAMAAGARPDPMLMAGIQNLPLGKGAGMRGPEPMTMRMLGISQTLPYSGKLRLRRVAAERELESARAAADATRRQVVRDVKAAYYELAFADQALAIVARSRGVLAGLIRATDARYSVGTAGQQDALKARVEATQLAETAVTLTEERKADLARLNALLDRPSETPVPQAEIPAVVAQAAVPASADEIRFTSAALGAPAANSPLPPLAELQAMAIRASPELRAHEAMIAAQAARLALAGKGALPDVDLSLQYGQRGGGLPDMVTATVSVPLPVFKRGKQDEDVAEASAQLEALHAEHDAQVNQLRADVARLAAELERSRTQLALYVKALLPQAHASLTAATANYQVGKAEFLGVLDDQTTVFTYETDYYRALSDFATNLAELERLVGQEIL